ncbi:hypothetical protein Y032_0086g1957 [Ancylostoma ceylanicum]|nr:hypothetical protein Y032_0086g1957 [Ancylostoma ceylanicum]
MLQNTVAVLRNAEEEVSTAHQAQKNLDDSASAPPGGASLAPPTTICHIQRRYPGTSVASCDDSSVLYGLVKLFNSAFAVTYRTCLETKMDALLPHVPFLLPLNIFVAIPRFVVFYLNFVLHI